MDKNNSTISISIPNPIIRIAKLKNYILSFALEMYNGPIRQRTSSGRRFFGNMKNPFKDFNFPRFDKRFVIKMVLPILIVVIFLLGAVSLLRIFNNSQSTLGVNQTVTIASAESTVNLNRTFSFPLRDDDNEEVGIFNYVIEDVEIRKQIIVKGQRATSVEGRIFLIFNLKITNSLDQSIQLNTRDYMRVVVSSNDSEFLAPDIHNDPVEVQAISTKYTRLGLAINESDTKDTIVLSVGEIEGGKQTIELNFK